MVIRDIIAPQGKIFLKSEWGPVSDEWPAVSFSKKSVGERLRAEFNPDRDVLLYVGTSDPDLTQTAAHRKAILSAIKVEPNAIYATRDLIPPASWARAQQGFRGRWQSSMAVRRAWDIPSLPSAKALVPESYRSLGFRSNWGNVSEVDPAERDALLDIEVRPLALQIQSAGTKFDDTRAFLNMDAKIRAEIARMADLISRRVHASGTQSVRSNPPRTADTELQVLLGKKWRDQQGNCALCQRPLAPGSPNPMLIASADRIDSSLGAYEAANVQIVHCGCNLAKNAATPEQFEEWLAIVRNHTSADRQP